MIKKIVSDVRTDLGLLIFCRMKKNTLCASIKHIFTKRPILGQVTPKLMMFWEMVNYSLPDL